MIGYDDVDEWPNEADKKLVGQNPKRVLVFRDSDDYIPEIPLLSFEVHFHLHINIEKRQESLILD